MTEPARPGFLATGARVDASGTLYDILVRADEIRSVSPWAARAVIPRLVDSHVHLDKAYQLACLDRLGVRPGS